MDKVNGLTSVGQERARLKQKDGRVATQRATNKATALNPTASPTGTFVQAAAPVQDNRTGLLINALASVSPALERFYKSQQVDLEKEQAQKVNLWAEQFVKDREVGAVNAAQVKEVFPEAVPTIAARVAQAAGEIQAKRWVQDRIQSVLEDDNLRLNTDNRRAFLDQVKAEALEISGGDDFYGSGFIDQVNRSLNEFDTSWMRETATYHEDVQAQSYASKVEEALRSGGNLLELDAQWRQSSSLNNVERNKIVVETAIAQAVSNQNPAMLQRVPKRFLNAESKAKIAQAQLQIENAMYSKFVQGKALQDYERSEALRNTKLNILQAHANGDEIRPTDYMDSPEAFEYAMRLSTQPRVNSTESVRAASTFKSNLMRAGTTGGFKDAFQDDPEFQLAFGEDGDVDTESLRDFILNRSDMNPKEKQELIEQVPLLMEGVSFVRNPDFTAHFNTYIGDDLKVFAQSVQGGILQKMGVNVQGSVRSIYFDRLRREVEAHIDEHGELPRGFARDQILLKAEDAAMKRLTYYQQNYREVLQEQSAQMTGNGQPSGGGQMNRNNKPSDNEEEGDYMTLPNGIRVKRVE